MTTRLRWNLPSLTKGQSAWLDVTRAVAAVLVVIHHVRNLFFVNYPAVSPSLKFSVAARGAYLLTALGHPAVMIFFVLSGFLISGSIFKALARDDWSWSWYLAQRLTRLWLVLVPALLLCILWDTLGTHLFGTEGVYGGLASNRYILWWSVPSHSGIGTLLGNILFVQNMYVPVFGSDGPLWSLSNEFWYYMLFPVTLLLLLGRGPVRKVSMVILLVAVLVVARPVLPYYPMWLLGVLVLLAPRLRLSAPLLRYSALILAFALTGGMLIATHFVQTVLLSDALVSLAFAASLYLLLSGSAPESGAKKAVTPTRIAAATQQCASGLAGFSYTLYLVHFPMLVFALATFIHLGIGRWQPDMKHLVLGALMVPPTLLYAWLISRVTEARTAVVRDVVWTRVLAQPGRVQPTRQVPSAIGKMPQVGEASIGLSAVE